MAYSAKEAHRAVAIKKKRVKEQEEAEIKRRKIEEGLQLGNISNKFSAHYDAIEQQLKSDTVGLVTLDEMRAKQEVMIREREGQLAQKEAAAHLKKEEARRAKKQKSQKGALSFQFDEEEEAGEDDPKSDSREDKSTQQIKIKQEDIKEVKEDKKVHTKTEKKRLGMNPDVDTSFLPDREREQEEQELRAKLADDWLQMQEDIKNEDITITYSYWDGRGHRRSCKMKKGNSIYQFLQKILDTLRKEECFNELKVATTDQLMYVKEDLILPHHSTFFEFIVTKARGKSGPLFTFDVKEDIRIKSDAAAEKTDSHAGKVVLRSWYERHKHIFPACRWEVYDPSKKWDNYTVKDFEKNKITVK